MSAAIFVRDDFEAEELRVLAGRVKDANQARRRLAIAAVYDGMDREEAARIGGMDRQTLRDWVHRFTGIALIMPNADTEAMQMHIDAIGRAVTPGAHALIILDKAGWHTTRKLKVPDSLTLVPLPPACPELNAAENIWQYLRQTYLANRVFDSYAAILDACQSAWRKLLAEVGRIASIATRDWATIGQ